MSAALAAPGGSTGAGRGPVRVMVVDDSVVVRGLVGRWIDEDPELEVVGKCANGEIAVKQMATARPDVVILDLDMPVMDGMTALPLLLAARPRPHVIVASTLTRRNAAITLRALSQGASECLQKPETNAGVTTSADFRRELLAKARALGGLDGSPSRAAAGRAPDGAPGTITLVPFNRVAPRLLAIGSSTGGPQALARVLADAGAGLASLPTVITQHMPATFTTMLAANLARTTGRVCKEGEDGESPRAGSIYVAPGGRHMTVRRDAGQLVLRIEDGPPVNFTRPSVDVMFRSIAGLAGLPALAVVLTGMGHDGAAGAAAIRAAGGNVIAQDEASSVVWGMPGATAVAGCCSAVLPVGQMGRTIARLAAGRFA